MWRSVGWLFAQGWGLQDALMLFHSGIVPVRENSSETGSGGRVRHVWIEEHENLEELRRAARFAVEGQRP